MAVIDDRMLFSGPADCLLFAINVALRVALLSVSGNRLAASRQALQESLFGQEMARMALFCTISMPAAKQDRILVQ